MTEEREEKLRAEWSRLSSELSKAWDNPRKYARIMKEYDKVVKQLLRKPRRK
jgi:hypothetical protein